MRRAARVDENQPEIVRVLRECGASVAVTSGVGAGFGDLVCGYRGVNFILELKDGSKSPGRQKLTPAEKKFHEEWRGQIAIVTNPVDALRVIGAI